jgi:hypothetical protein
MAGPKLTAKQVAAAQQKVANTQFKATQARNAKTSTPGRTPVVNAATGFTTGTKAVIKPAASPRATGYQPSKAPSNPLGGVGQFIQQHIDLATGKTPTNISDALHGGMDRGYSALDPNRGRK